MAVPKKKKKNPKQLPQNVVKQRRKVKAVKEPKKAKPAPKVGRIRLWTNDPPLEVTARLGEERPNVESGYGGWEEVARPRRRPLTSWQGLPALRMTIPILFNGWASDTSQEGEIAALEKMAGGRLAHARGGEPPLVHIKALGSAVPYQGRTWVITELAWGEALMNQHGNRVRQHVTVSLLEYIADAFISMRSASQRRRQSKQSKHPKPSSKNRRVSLAQARQEEGRDEGIGDCRVRRRRGPDEPGRPRARRRGALAGDRGAERHP